MKESGIKLNVNQDIHTTTQHIFATKGVKQKNDICLKKAIFCLNFRLEQNKLALKQKIDTLGKKN